MDRFIDSSVAYQGDWSGLNQDEIAFGVNAPCDWMGIKPDATLIVWCDPETGRPAAAASGEREVNRLIREAWLGISVYVKVIRFSTGRTRTYRSIPMPHRLLKML